MPTKPLPLGKLPLDLLTRLLPPAGQQDPRVLLGPGIGLDCAVIDNGDRLLVLKSDPITFATDEIGWYLAQVNANDIATTGAKPRWLLATLLLPENATPQLAETIFTQIQEACRAIGVTLIGGHSEVTHGLDRPILAGAMIGEVARERLVTPRGASPGDRILLTKGVPIEATTILAREFAGRLAGALSADELAEAQNFLTNPGISVLRDAEIALAAGRVTAMHDPTEGGVLAALWELAIAAGRTLTVDPAAIPIPPLSARICRLLELDPLAAIASGALLITVAGDDAGAVRQALETEGIACAEIGLVEAGRPMLRQATPDGYQPLPHPQRDEIARAFESETSG